MCGPAGLEPPVGLTRSAAQALIREHGYNEVAERPEHPLRRFLGKFWGLSAWMLELIMVLSAVLGKYADLAIVAALLVLNAVLAFAQERRAAGVVQALRRRLQVSTRVLRDATWQVIAARELVPGDIVRIRSGDIVPADLKLLDGTLSVDQSALTGESKDIDKAAGDDLVSGSVVRRGEGNARVMLTGARTLFGRTTELVQQARPKLHIEAIVARVVRWLFVIVGAMLALVMVVSLVQRAPLLEMIPLMLVLLMSAVPVALPVMFTVSMAVGSNELAKLGVLVTRLSAAEDAATMDVLCVDKTGTITKNQLAVTGVITLDGATESEVLLAGALASQEADQDPIDLAFLAASARQAGAWPDGVHARFIRALRCEEPAHRSGRQPRRSAAACDEGCRAHGGLGLRPRRAARSKPWKRGSATRPARATGPWRWRGAPRREHPCCSDSSHWSIRFGRTPRN